MSNRDELSDAQKKQNKVGEAGSNPETSPAENLREKAAKMTDKSQNSEEPAQQSSLANPQIIIFLAIDSSASVLCLSFASI
jgi:hypothetical protein